MRQHLETLQCLVDKSLSLFLSRVCRRFSPSPHKAREKSLDYRGKRREREADTHKLEGERERENQKIDERRERERCLHTLRDMSALSLDSLIRLNGKEREEPSSLSSSRILSQREKSQLMSCDSFFLSCLSKS